MKNYMYVIYDKIGKDSVLLGIASTDGAFIRQNKPYLEKMNPQFLDDYEVYCVGSFITTDCTVEPLQKRLVDWHSYNVPEKPVEE